MSGFKYKYACFACRKMFRIEPAKRLNTDPAPICPDCATPMRFVGTKFHPPRRSDKQAWEAAELLYISGHPYQADTFGRRHKGIARAGQAKRYIEANPHRRSEGARLLAKYRKRTGK